MADSDASRRFIEEEIEALAPLDFLVIGPAGRAFHMLEVCRCDGGKLEVRVPGRPPIVQGLTDQERASLRERGFESEDPSNSTIAWVSLVETPREGFELASVVIQEIFEEKDTRLDVFHGSHRDEYEARQKLAEVRSRVERVVEGVISAAPQQDSDGDYLLPLGDVRVAVSPRAVPGGPTLVRVFCVTNVGVTVTPDLGLLLARLNFNLVCGRFALDADRRAILFDETLLGDPLNEDALRFAIDVVATTADEWDDRLKQMFGGATYQEILKQAGGDEKLPAKPGHPDGRRTDFGLYL